jgi:hypothetical protein
LLLASLQFGQCLQAFGFTGSENAVRRTRNDKDVRGAESKPRCWRQVCSVASYLDDVQIVPFSQLSLSQRPPVE